MNEWEWQLLEEKPPIRSVEIQGVEITCGDSVRLVPKRGGDVLDIALKGKIAAVESIQQDYEGNMYVCVVVEDDPGRDIGLMRQPGHRFFFSPAELEPIRKANEERPHPAQSKRILVAGIGNIFLGDDGFGVEVAGRLASTSFPPGVRITDFGIRGFDLAYALMDGYETTILVDAYPGDGQPGTLFVVEPNLSDLDSPESQQTLIEPHSMNPMNVLRMTKKMGAHLKRVLVVGCVPATLGPEEGQMGLSEPVAAAVEDAVKLVHSLVTQILAGKWPAAESRDES